MSFVFSNDETLGYLDSRIVILRGSTRVSQLFSPNLFPIDSWLKSALENAGFGVVGVRSSAAAWIGYDINVEIELNVFNNHTSEEARRNATAAIEAFTANWGLNKVFSNTSLGVAFDAYVPPSSGGQSQNQPSSSPSVYNYYSNPQSGNDGAFLDNLGLGLGVSTPIVLAGAVLVGFLILRR